MLALLSPAKRLDFDPSERKLDHTKPVLLDQARLLVDRSRKLVAADLMKLMGISQDLADLNVQRFRDFATPFTPDNAKQAILAFRGDTYVGFDADTLSDPALEYAQDHVRILSGLYGVLRPLDLIQPYRLEMGTRLETERGKNLYGFWENRITDAVNAAAESAGDDVVVNLASHEYFGAVKTARLAPRLVECAFKEVRNGVPKIISFNAKKARGMMARFICEEQVDRIDSLREFREDGYRYVAKASSKDVLEFHRPQP